MKTTTGRRGGSLLLGGTLVVAALAGTTPVAAQEAVQVGDTLGLAEAVRIALDRNREIQAARFQLEEAEERVSEAWGNVFPSVDFSMTYTRNLSPAVNFVPAKFFDPDAADDEFAKLQFGADNQWAGSISVDQPLFNGAAFLGVGAAGRFESLQQEVLRGETQRVVTTVRRTYYDLLLAQEQARLTENSVRRVRESLEETRALQRAGLVSDYDVLRLEVELANLEPNLLRARNAVRQARRQLALALDLESGEGLAVMGSLATMDITTPGENTPGNRAVLEFAGVDLDREITEEEIGELAARAADVRSDVRQLELTRSLRETEMRVEQVAYLPRVSVFGNYTANSSQNGDPEFFGSPRAYGRQAGVQVTLPLFQGFQRDARVDQKRAVGRATVAKRALARDQAESQVEALIDQIQEARATARGQALAVTQAQRGFEIARAQFREGLSSQLELTDAEVALRQSEFNYAQAVYDFLVARAQLDQAAGSVPLIDPTLARIEARDDPPADGADDTTDQTTDDTTDTTDETGTGR